MGFLRKRSLCRRYVAYEPGPRRLAGIVVGCLHVTPTLASGHNGGRGGGHCHQIPSPKLSEIQRNIDEANFSEDFLEHILCFYPILSDSLQIH